MHTVNFLAPTPLRHYTRTSTNDPEAPSPEIQASNRQNEGRPWPPNPFHWCWENKGKTIAIMTGLTLFSLGAGFAGPILSTYFTTIPLGQRNITLSTALPPHFNITPPMQSHELTTPSPHTVENKQQGEETEPPVKSSIVTKPDITTLDPLSQPIEEKGNRTQTANAKPTTDKSVNEETHQDIKPALPAFKPNPLPPPPTTTTTTTPNTENGEKITSTGIEPEIGIPIPDQPSQDSNASIPPTSLAIKPDAEAHLPIPDTPTVFTVATDEVPTSVKVGTDPAMVNTELKTEKMFSKARCFSEKPFETSIGQKLYKSEHKCCPDGNGYSWQSIIWRMNLQLSKHGEYYEKSLSPNPACLVSSSKIAAPSEEFNMCSVNSPTVMVGKPFNYKKEMSDFCSDWAYGERVVFQSPNGNEILPTTIPTPQQKQGSGKAQCYNDTNQNLATSINTTVICCPESDDNYQMFWMPTRLHATPSKNALGKPLISISTLPQGQSQPCHIKPIGLTINENNAKLLKLCSDSSPVNIEGIGRYSVNISEYCHKSGYRKVHIFS